MTDRPVFDDTTPVANYRIDSIAGLARQLAFTPAAVRLKQVAAAESLLLEIEADKAYPLDFVTFRISGYRPKDVETGDLLTGIALLHDLGLLVEEVSETLDLRADASAEPVLSIDDVCERFNVTSKTIQRWRKRGLPSRKIIFGDEKKRVGFLVSSVERFFSTHRDQVDRGANFSQVGEPERQEILRRARRLAEKCHCCTQEISRRIGRHLNRSPVTIHHIIRQHDQAEPADAIFLHAAAAINDDERTEILRGYKRGLALGRLARRTCRPRSAVYRVIVEEKLARLAKRKVKFIDDELYHQESAELAIEAITEVEEIGAPRSEEESRVPRDLPPYLRELYRVPLLSPARERALFLKFNFHKYQFVAARRRLDPQFARARELNLMTQYLRKAVETKNAIVRANLRLVVSVAKRHLRPNLSLMELVSEGNVTLMRAVDSFNTQLGNKFSTYATFALMKAFARAVPAMRSNTKLVGGQVVRTSELSGDFADRRLEQAVHHVFEREHVQTLLTRLDDRERQVLVLHYGLELDGTTIQPATLEEVGTRLGLSKQRVRQIEQGALLKLRETSSH